VLFALNERDFVGIEEDNLEVVLVVMVSAVVDNDLLDNVGTVSLDMMYIVVGVDNNFAPDNKFDLVVVYIDLMDFEVDTEVDIVGLHIVFSLF